ncbi:Flp family type IVb pilin [Novosphingobium sp.]|uniref:Flp family type IVb pilin n=1 Tax=Novosphingobium sp. TaxID=1874826 RepID=UPI0035B4E334
MIKPILKELIHDERGTSAIEMGLICSLIVLAMFTALQNFADASHNTWNTVTSKTHDAVTQSTGG